MKIAIVRGGFEGIRKQHTIWRLEREVEQAETALQHRVELTERARVTLRGLQNQLTVAQFNQEITPWQSK